MSYCWYTSQKGRNVHPALNSYKLWWSNWLISIDQSTKFIQIVGRKCSKERFRNSAVKYAQGTSQSFYYSEFQVPTLIHKGWPRTHLTSCCSCMITRGDWCEWINCISGKPICHWWILDKFCKSLGFSGTSFENTVLSICGPQLYICKYKWKGISIEEKYCNYTEQEVESTYYIRIHSLVDHHKGSCRSTVKDVW